jgi:hypothetical protein
MSDGDFEWEDAEEEETHTLLKDAEEEETTPLEPAEENQEIEFSVGEQENSPDGTKAKGPARRRANAEDKASFPLPQTPNNNNPTVYSYSYS